MKALGESSIASFIRFVLDATWWVVVVTLALVIALLAFTCFVNNADGKNLTMNLPVAVELSAPVHAATGALPTDARIESLRGNLQFAVQNDAFFFANGLLVILLLIFVLWALTQLRHIFRSLSRGLVFIPENARRMRWVGFAVIVGELARAALVYIWSYYTSQHFTANGLRFVASTEFNGSTIIAGLAILVIAEVFREGTRLHEEQSLTI